MIYFTSDHHFGHFNVIKYCDRPFSYVEEMDRTMEENWNNTVKPEDTVYVLGDFSFYNIIKTNEILDRLAGHKILLPGNHDKKYVQWNFNEILSGNSTLQIDNDVVLLSHYPYPPSKEELAVNPYDVRYLDRRYEDKGQWLLHGHVHEKWKARKKMINVGVDVWEFKPASIEEIKEIINKGETE